MTNAEKKKNLLKGIHQQLLEVKVMLDFADLALKEPDDHATLGQLRHASQWLASLLRLNVSFTEAYTQPHTSVEFWDLLKVTGIPKHSLHADLFASKQMRGLLACINAKFNKRPEVFGGKTKTATEA